MPRPKSEIPLEQKPIRLFEGDFARLQRLFPRLGASVAIRKIVRNFLDRAEASAKPIEIDLPTGSVEELIND